ncbi:Cell division protein FtsN [Dickeya aquatica]|uniref:Cell division protein FtsN n=2 Tax=Pectobacteriaceae TaxID=1903410 RepID=A0A375AG46_9GAMM|nr:Cell division protein FtsN [Dickeya aquatica]
MMALAVAVLVTFAGGLYFIAHNKPDESPILPHQSTKGNGLPPKPEERWRYIKELENRQIGVTSPTEPSAGGEVQSPGQLTDEQRQLLDQMQSDMKRQPTMLNEVPYNDQSQMPTRAAPKSQMVVPVVPGGNAVTLQPSTPRTTATPPPAPTPRHTAPATPAQTQSPGTPKTPAADVRKPEPPVRETVKAENTKAETPRAESTRTENTKPDSAKPDTTKPEKEPRWMVQCGSFKTAEPAESVRAELAFAGVESRITNSGGWHRIILGPYGNRATADKMAQKLKAMGQSNCIPLASGG